LERLREKRCEFYRKILIMTRTTFRIFKSKRGTITFPKMCTSGSGDRGNRSNYLRTLPAAVGDTAGLQPIRNRFQSVDEVECDQRGGQRQPNVGGGSTDRGILVPFYKKRYRTARPS
jgi:hypothetical protein